MIIDGRCNVCRIKKDHRFAECLSSKCECQCVSQIYKLPKNENQDDITSEHPLFLEVSAPEVMALDNWEHTIRNFNHIKKEEWIDLKKKDKRRKNASSTNYWGH